MGDLESNYAEQYELIIYCCKGKARQLVSDKRPTNVLTFDRVVSQLHPTEKPVDLLKELINNSTVDNEVVLDPFAGSGSLGVACQETTRQFILIEKEEEYCNIIKKRLG
jgi:site-specific DNA-methyltransferase (adenine-specific)